MNKNLGSMMVDFVMTSFDFERIYWKLKRQYDELVEEMNDLKRRLEYEKRI